ncbi:retrovirus-related pol polyprotein from transposon TNT 1-94 [Tanacetum coccineum]
MGDFGNGYSLKDKNEAKTDKTKHENGKSIANLSEDIQCAGSDTRPPMLDRTDFASWQQRIRLYCRGKENGVNILKSIDEGPFQMGTFRETLAEGNKGALHLGLPKDIYSLINHYTDAKDIWDNVKMLLEGSELTKEDRESQLYNDFEHVRQHKGETIYDYYYPEWGRFVTAVKLNRGLRDSNYDQLTGLKNLLIANDNLIADCLSEEVFYVATNSELNVYSFAKMHDAHTSLKARCLELEVELSNLRDKIQKDNHTELVKWFSNLEITHAKHLEQTTAILTENESLKVQIQNKLLCVNKDHVKPKVLVPGKYAIDVEPIPPRNRNNREVYLVYLKHLKESVETLREIELLEYVIDTCPKDLNTLDNKHASTPLPKKKQVTFEEQCAMSKSNTHKPVEQLNCQKTNVPVPPSTGVNSCTDASISQPRSNTKKNRILPAKSVNMKKVEEHPRTIKSSLKSTNHVDSSISSKHTVVQIVLWYLDSGCSKHMTGDRSRLRNFVKKFIGTVRFENDHFGAIMGYGDYVIGESVISRVYYVEGLGHNLFSVGQFCDSDLEVAFRKHSCYVRDTNGVELIKGSRGSNLYTISIEDMMKSSLICLLSKASKNKSWLWHRRLNHLNFGNCSLGEDARDLCCLGSLDVSGSWDVGFTWVKFLRSKDETPEVVIKFLKQIQVNLNKTVRNIRTDNGTDFVNKDLTDYYERVGIFHQKIVSRTPQQNNVIKRRNCTLVEAARTMLIFSKAPMFLWAEVVATTCYTQNRSLIHTRHYKTPYELVHDKKPDLTFFRVFSALCYPINDSKDLGKLQPIADI